MRSHFLAASIWKPRSDTGLPRPGRDPGLLRPPESPTPTPQRPRAGPESVEPRSFTTSQAKHRAPLGVLQGGLWLKEKQRPWTRAFGSLGPAQQHVNGTTRLTQACSRMAWSGCLATHTPQPRACWRLRHLQTPAEEGPPEGGSQAEPQVCPSHLACNRGQLAQLVPSVEVREQSLRQPWRGRGADGPTISRPRPHEQPFSVHLLPRECPHTLRHEPSDVEQVRNTHLTHKLR